MLSFCGNNATQKGFINLSIGWVKRFRTAILNCGYSTAVELLMEWLKLFGSVARGHESSDSDVDFLVEMEPARSLLDLDLPSLRTVLDQMIEKEKK